MRFSFLAALVLILSLSTLAQNIDFTEISGTPFPGVHFSYVAFADVDGDGDQDLLITGNGGNQQYARLYLNDSTGSFSMAIGTPFDRVQFSAVAFADIDNDNDQDVIITGMNSDANGQPSAKLYTNDGTGSFTEVTGTSFQNVEKSSLAFADFDNDNDQDLIIAGDNGNAPITRLYENDGNGNFTTVNNTSFAGASSGSIAVADVNGDSLIDIFISGENPNLGGQISRLYLNNDTLSFTQAVGSAFPQLFSSSVAFADIDNDGDQDLMLCGQEGFPRTSALMTNDGTGIFTEVTGTPFLPVNFASIAFADVDMDNDQDLLITGSYSFQANTMLYENDSLGGFDSVTGLALEDVFQGSIAFADIDGDMDMDLLITGLDISGNPVSKLYRNNLSIQPVGINTDVESEIVQIFPNPVNNHMHIKTSHKIQEIIIHSLIGEFEESIVIANEEIILNVSELSNGIYLFTIIEEDGNRKIKKVIIEH